MTRQTFGEIGSILLLLLDTFNYPLASASTSSARDRSVARLCSLPNGRKLSRDVLPTLMSCRVLFPQASGMLFRVQGIGDVLPKSLNPFGSPLQVVGGGGER